MKVKTLKVSSLAVMATPAACTLSSCSDTTSTINIVGLNDFHGNVSAYHNYDDAYESRIACIADKYQQIRKNREDKTELILIGDNSDRSAIGQFSDQRAPVNLLSNLDIKYSVFGNHEGYLDPDIYFNPLSESDLTKWGKFRSYLACNNYWYGGQYQQAIYCDYFKPYAIEHIGDLNVGIVAYSAANTTTTTPSTKGLYCADATDDTTIFGNTGKTGAQILQESIDACRNDSLNLNNGIKPDVVILAQHEGIAPDNSGQWDTNSGSFKVISKISGVDASFDAHTHFHYNLEAKDKTGKSIPVAQGQPYGQSLSNLTISYNKKKTKFNFSFQDEPINEQTDIGQLENKDTAMVKDTKASLQKWYDYVINEEGETLQEKINTELGDFKIDEKNKDKELVFPYDTLPNEVFSRGGHLVVDAYLDMFDTSKSIPSTTVDAALDEINTKFGENEIAGSIINRFNFSSSLIPSKGLGTTTSAATVAAFFDL
ncbi:MAG: metallophosphoesterase, partial [Malacoplasma sp.]|nr:metallophosphoesterase [Malacoplasma sp.]